MRISTDTATPTDFVPVNDTAFTQSEANTSDEEDWVDDLSAAFRHVGDDGFPTETSDAQREVEESILELYEADIDDGSLTLQRPLHKTYLMKHIHSLPGWFSSLDASKPWLVYWILHSLDLLSIPISQGIAKSAIETLRKCQVPEGGFAGGPSQLAHVATTYAAVSALAVIGTSEAFDMVDRRALHTWLLTMKQPDGSFTMHDGGEVDVRGLYCALSTAKLLDILTPDLLAKSTTFIAACQTHEGGIGAVPGVEAHGGYTFCAIAAAEIAGGVETLDLDLLTRWLAFRQMEVEGGFQGRTNKLVDGCYSFWQGGVAPILECVLERRRSRSVDESLEEPATVDFFNREQLQKYILACCQDPKGGLRDKPEKGPDYYHTCYVLSGLSASQHRFSWDEGKDDFLLVEGAETVLGVESNLLAATHPIHNVRPERVERMVAHFRGDQLELTEVNG
ncbi:hypothetical protein HKX48_008729 [Thoreauomyces humboldtii]|nr:hypothetical protein HKX48_008729 [Thoreauomyces humboldtii]